MHLHTLLTAKSPSNTTIHLLHNDKLRVHVSALTDHHKATYKTSKRTKPYTYIFHVTVHIFTIYLLCMSVLYVALLTEIVSLRPTHSKSLKNQNILKL
jgi:hypothetical protein